MIHQGFLSNSRVGGNTVLFIGHSSQFCTLKFHGETHLEVCFKVNWNWFLKG